MSGVGQSGGSRPVHATVSVHLRIPGDVAARMLTGTVYEGTVLGQEPDHDREAIGEILDERIAEDFHHLLDYADIDPEAEADW